MKINGDRFGGKLGIGLALIGFVLVFLGWNGAASSDRVSTQFPYLISGGIAGLCFVVIGAALIIAETRREDASRLEAKLEQLRLALTASDEEPEIEEVGTGPTVVCGQHTYHRTTCRLLDGRGALARLPLDTAKVRGLVACRVCYPTPSTTSLSRSRPRSRRR